MELDGERVSDPGAVLDLGAARDGPRRLRLGKRCFFRLLLPLPDLVAAGAESCGPSGWGC